MRAENRTENSGKRRRATHANVLGVQRVAMQRVEAEDVVELLQVGRPKEKRRGAVIRGGPSSGGSWRALSSRFRLLAGGTEGTSTHLLDRCHRARGVRGCGAWCGFGRTLVCLCTSKRMRGHCTRRRCGAAAGAQAAAKRGPRYGEPRGAFRR